MAVGNTAAGVDWTYDSLGRATALSRAPVAISTSGTTTTVTLGTVVSTTTVAYDLADRMTALTHYAPATNTTPLEGYTFTYTPASQVATAVGSNPAFDWTGGTAGTVNKTADGLNRDASIATVGSPCAATGAGYDCNGNLTYDGTRVFAYDGENRLLTDTIKASGIVQIALAYDPLGRLQQTTAGSTVTQYLYDDNALVAEYNGSTMLARFVHGPGVDNPLIWFQGAAFTTGANPSYLVADRQGSIIATLGANGVETGTPYSYDAYGNPSSWPIFGFGYTGQLGLQQAQLWHYKARAYDPVSGHFLQTDPVGYTDDVDLYAYVGDDPANKADPTGQGQDSCPKMVAGDSCYYVGEDDDLMKAAQKAKQVVNNFFHDQAKELKDHPLVTTFNIGVALVVNPEDGETGAGPTVLGEEFLEQKSVSIVEDALAKICGCFVADTLVETDRGLRPIQRIKVGDLVVSRDEVSGKTDLEPVMGLIRPHGRSIYEVRLGRAKAGMVETFKVTDDHPWRSKDGRWLTTLQLMPGMQIQTEDGKGVAVVSVADTGHVADTYNLEVTGFHTFFVGRERVWVHNGPCTLLSNAESGALAKFFGSNEAGAQALLKRIASGEKIELPNGVTPSSLERYVQQVSLKPATAAKAVHQMRFEIIKLLLGK